MTSTNNPPPKFILPWPCLADSTDNPINPPFKPVAQKKSFADAVNNVCDIPFSQLPKPVIKGDEVAIAIPDDEYLIGLAACKHNLHGRVLWPKGTIPLKVGALKSKLSILWKSLGRWGITSLGRGYYEFSFSSLEDAQSVRSTGSWNLNPGFLKLFTWSENFSPSMQQQSSAQVWVRIYGLSQEYWRPKILFAIASSVGTPICIDHATNKPMFEREFGHFARVLVDMDLRKTPKYRVLVERTGFAFFVDLDYDNLPQYCNFCSCIGHQQSNCKRANPELAEKEKNKNPRRRNEGRKEFVVTKDNRGTVENEQAIPAETNNPSEHIEQHKVIYNVNNDIDTPTPGNNIQGSPVDQHLHESSDELESVASEFVDETQQIVSPQKSLTTDQNSSPSDNNTTPVRVKKDMEFLQKSWANLADKELEDDINKELQIQYSNQNSPVIDQQDEQEAPFQLVVKRKKKGNAKSTYQTRSKVDKLNLG